MLMHSSSPKQLVGATDCGIIQARISGQHAGVAQSVEQGICNAQVAGSSPVASSRRENASFLFAFCVSANRYRIPVAKHNAYYRGCMTWLEQAI